MLLRVQGQESQVLRYRAFLVLDGISERDARE